MDPNTPPAPRDRAPRRWRAALAVVVAAALVLAGADVAQAAVSSAEGSTAGGSTAQLDVAGQSFVKVFSSSNATTQFALTDTGQVYGWGWNGYDQLATGNTTASSTPVLIGGALTGKTITQVAVGNYFAMAMDSNRNVYAWGDNTGGEYGNGTLTNSSVPVQVPATGFLSTRTVQGIAAGVNQAYAWFTDGTVAAWGYNDIGQLGIGYVGNAASSPSSNAVSTPTQVVATGVLSGKLVTQVATGNGTALAVTSDGGIDAWGNGNVGALGNGVTTNNNVTSPISLASAGALSGKRITQVAEGDHQSLALGSDGTLYSWGNNACSSSLGQNNTSIQYSGTPAAVTNTPFSGKTITQIASGYTHDTALASDGTAYAWGCNESGELGTGNTTAYPLPVVAGTTGGLSGKTIVSIAAFGATGAAVASDGTAYSWGNNNTGQLGNGTTSPSTSSTIVADTMPSVGVTFGGTAATGVTRLGPTSVSAVVPAHSAGTTNVVITVGGNATYPSVATTLSNAYTYDAVPTITTQSFSNPTVGVPYSRTVATSGSGTIAFAVTTGALPPGLSLGAGSGTISGTPTVAGTSTFQITATNASGSSVSPTYSVTTQAGPAVTPADGPPAGGTTVQVGVTGMSFAKIFSSEASYATFGVTDTGALYAWGWNASGQLGIGSQTNANVPTPVGGALAGKTITQLVQGQKTTLALASDNTLYAWGDDTYGEYGNGTTSTTPTTTPVQIPLSGGLAGKTIAQIASGSYSMIAVATDGTVATWGYGGNGQLGNNTNSTSVYASTPVAINSFGALASLGSGVTITRVAMSDNDTYAVASNNAIYSWGAGVGGQLGNNTSSGSALVPGAVTTSGTPLAGQTVAQFVASTNDAYVLTGTGSLVAWGFNDNGQIGNGSTTATPGGALLPTAVTIPTGTGKTITQISAGGASASALTQDGTLYAWGSNGSGQLGSGTTTNSTMPTAVTVGGKTVSQIAGTYLDSYAIATDGSAYAVGRDSEGNLGNSSVSNASALTMLPVTMPTVALSFGGTAATSVTRTSASTVSAVTPAHASGVVNVIAAVGGNALYPTVSTTLSNAFTYDTAPTITTGATLPGGIVGSAYSQTIAGTATGVITWSVTSGALPAGLALNAATGVIGGTPTTAVAGSFTVTATTAAGTDARAFTLAVAASPVVSSTPSSLADPVVGTAYSATFAASGTGPYTYTVTSGAVPAGLTLVTSTGVLSGTPTTAGAASFVISATSSSGTWASSTYSVTTRTAAAITAATLPDPVVGQNYGGTVTATGSGPLTFSISAGTLPDGLAIASSTGVITGQPTTTGSSTFTVSVAGAYGAAATRSYTVVTHAAPTITTATLPDPVVGVTYPGAVAATGSATITYAVTSGTIPTGLSFDTVGGGFTGTPTTAGAYSFVVRASNSWGAASTSYSVTVRTAPVVTTTTLPNGLVGSAYSGGTVAASGSGSMSFAVTAGSLPAGLTLTASGAITGTPTTGGTSTFSVTATSTYGTSSAQSLSIVVKVAPTITTTTLPNPTLNVAYSQTLAATGDSTIAFTVTSGTLPTGLTLNSTTGILAGTTTSGTSRTFTVTATNSSGSNAVVYTLVPGAAPVVASGSLAGAVVGTAYSQSVATSGDGAVTYTVASGTLPTGLTLVASSGVISGTPTAAGTFTFTTTATSQYGTATSTSTQIVVLSPPSITTTTLPDATVGTAYSATVAASGSATITFAVTSGTLPAGLGLDGSTGIVSGTPTTPGAATFTITATSSAGSSSRIFRVATFTAPTITTATVPDPLVGAAYSTTIVATGSGPISFSVASGALPAGLSLGASTGLISGTPTTAGAASFAISATSAYGSASTHSYSVVTHTAPAITSSSLASPVIGAAYSSTVGATGSGPLVFAVTSGALPAGLALNTSTGEIAGTPTATGSASFTVTVTSPYGSASQAFTLAPTTAATITTSSLADPTLGTAYSATIAASGGGPITFAVTAGALPAGLALTASTGVIAGTATATGASTFTITATNSSGSGAAVYTLIVGTAPVVSSATLADPVVGAAYSGTVAGSGTGVVTFAVTSGALPAGLALTASSGALTGTPTTAGSATFTVTATSEYGSGTGSFTVVVRTVPAISTLSLTSPTVGAAYSATVAATGSGPITFAVSTGSLPAGLALTGSTGAITGTATTAGSSTFTISATSAFGSTAQAYTLVTGTAPSITSSSVPNLVVGTAYNATVTASGSPTIAFAVTSGALPAGVTLIPSTGALSGTPTTAGSATFVITASSTYGSATQSFTVVARTAPAISTLTLADPTVGSAYSATVAATGSGSLAFSVASGALPAGLTLDASTGIIAGTPTVPGSYSFTIAVTSAYGSDSRAYRLVAFTPPVITTAAIPVPVVGAAYSATIVATGSGPITFSVSSGTLPTGLTLNASTGVLSGTPSTAGSSTFTVLATSAYGTDSHSYTVGTTNLPSIATTSLPDAIVGSAYSATVVATGSGVISFTVSGGSLPAGLSLNTATGEIFGTATTAASSTFTILATNASGSSSQSLTILARTGLAITTASLPNPTVGSAYSATVAASGSGSITFSVSSGTLPTGLVLGASSGLISGTPTVAGSFTFVVTATSSSGSTTRSYTVVAGAAPSVLTTSLADPSLGLAYGVTIATTGGGTPTFAVSTGALPAGITLNPSSGLLAGVPTTAGAAAFTISVTTEYGTAQQAYTMTVRTLPAITTTSLPDPVVGTAYTATVVSTGSGPLTFAVSSGVLPTGVVLDPTSGALSGTPTASGSFPFVVTATSAYGVASRSYRLVTFTAPTIITASLDGAVVGTTYSAIVAAAGSGPIVFTLGSSPLPTGLALDGTTGVISGTPTAVGTWVATITATSAYGSTSHSFTTIVRSAPSIAATALADPVVGAGYTATLAASGSGPVSFSISSGSLPAGLGLDAASGSISGTPVTAGAASFTVTATNLAGFSSRSYTLTVHLPPTITTASVADALSGSPYSATVAATGDGPFGYAVASGALPAGLAMSASGVISGTPTAAGTSTFGVSATSSYGVATRTYTIAVRVAPSISTTTLPDGLVGTAYSGAVVAAGTGSIAFSMTSGALPAGLSLDPSTGALVGTPTIAASSTFTITATTPWGTAAHAFTIAVHAAPTITANVLPSGVTATAYSATIATSGTGAISVTVPAGTLPAGLALDSTTGVLSGTPTAAGSTTFTATATNAYGSVTQTYTLTVLALSGGGGSAPTPAPVIVTRSLAAGIAGDSYSAAIGATNALSFGISSGLPDGLRFDTTTGVISGTPASTGTFSFSVTVVGVSGTASADYSLTVWTPPSIVSSALPDGITGAVYAEGVQALGDGAVTYGIERGALPTGLGLDSATGAIVGTPTGTGTAAFTISATSPYGTASASYSIAVHAVPRISTQSIRGGIAGTGYQQLLAVGGSGPVTFAVTAGALPSGVTLGSTTGLLSGTPATSGTFSFTVSASNPWGSTTAVYALSVLAPPSITTTTLAGGQVGSDFAQRVAATGDGTIGFGVTSGALPAGLSLDSASGVISGTPTAAGSAAFIVTASSVDGSDARSFTIDVAVAPQVQPLTIAAPHYAPQHKRYLPGATVRVTASGLVKGEKYRIVIGKKVVRTGVAGRTGRLSVVVKVPATVKTAKTPVKVLGATHAHKKKLKPYATTYILTKAKKKH